MLITNFLSVLLDFVDSIMNKFDIKIEYSNYLDGLSVWSYGVHVLGAALFYAIISSVIAFYVFKVIFSVFNWLWQQLPLT